MTNNYHHRGVFLLSSMYAMRYLRRSGSDHKKLVDTKKNTQKIAINSRKVLVIASATTTAIAQWPLFRYNLQPASSRKPDGRSALKNFCPVALHTVMAVTTHNKTL